MRLSFLLLVASVATAAFTTVNASSTDQAPLAKVLSPDLPTIDQADAKRLLRTHHHQHARESEMDADKEERVGGRMKVSASFKKKKFSQWLGENLSSYTVWTSKLKEKEKYRGLYNEYAALRKANPQYP
jgi:hypothetical protein